VGLCERKFQLDGDVASSPSIDRGNDLATTLLLGVFTYKHFVTNIF